LAATSKLHTDRSDRRRFVAARLAEALENAGPRRVECTGSQDRSATMDVPFPRTWTVSVLTVEPSQVNNPVPVGFCGENGPDDTMAEPVLTLLPFACESDTLTESLRVMSPGLPIGWHTTWIGTESNRRFVTWIGVPTVNVSCGVAAPAVEAIPNTAALHARTARMTPDKILRFMGLVPSDSMVMGRNDGLTASEQGP
jgi:hypothetical protein